MQEVTELEAQRKAFTSRLPKVRAESEAIRNEEARSKSLLASATKARAAAASSSPLPPPAAPPSSSSPPSSSAEQFRDERRQQQLQELKREGAASASADGEVGGLDVGGRELTLEDFPYRFLDEDQEPEEGINIYDVEANIAAARAAKAAAEAGTPPPLHSPRQPPQRQEAPAAQGFAHPETAPAPHDSRPGENAERTLLPPQGTAFTVTRSAEIPPTPPPPQPQQATAGGTVRAQTNAGVGPAARDVGRGSWGGPAAAAAGGGGGTADARRERASAAAAGGTGWSMPSSEAPPAVTVMGGVAGAGGGVEDSVMERVAREAEEQTERMDEDDGVFEGGLMGW